MDPYIKPPHRRMTSDSVAALEQLQWCAMTQLSEAMWPPHPSVSSGTVVYSPWLIHSKHGRINSTVKELDSNMVITMTELENRR